MYNHAPKGYVCPFCLIASGKDVDSGTKQSEVVFRDEDVTVFISSMWWPKNPGHVLVIPNKHFENIYDAPEEKLCLLMAALKKVAIALKEVYKCEGVSVRQHNEPAGNQDVWHLHFAAFPRYLGDELYVRHKEKKPVKEKERERYARLLRNYFKK